MLLRSTMPMLKGAGFIYLQSTDLCSVSAPQ